MNADTPWFKRAFRWGQTNLTEDDPESYDHARWREHWKRTRVQGVIVNAGGIVAYYPSRFPLQRRAAKLRDRDLFGEIAQAAREEGLALLARMDSNRASADFYETHPDWFAVDREGKPYRAGEYYIACVNSPYYGEYLPDVLREIVERYRPDGFADNSWTGLGFRSVCHCAHCREGFGAEVGGDLPEAADWEDPAYRKWVRWNYARRVAIWRRNNKTTRQAGGENCLWMGMVNANPMASHLNFCDLRRVCRDAPVVMTDHQSRDALNGFEQNELNGKLLHELSSWDALIPESMAHYVRGHRPFRKASMPREETLSWMREGLAGGIAPWWHHIGASHEDRRQLGASEALLRWHEQNEDALFRRSPVASIGLVWSQDNIDFYGREQTRERVALPWRGWTKALVRQRLPFLPVHADDIEAQVGRLDVLVLPSLAAMSDAQIAALKAFVEAGGSLAVTGVAGRLDEDGEPRPSYALAELLGFEPDGDTIGAGPDVSRSWEKSQAHNYFRLHPDALPTSFQEGWSDTRILPFGGTLWTGEAQAGATVALTYVPAFPIYPPEFSWMRERDSGRPALLFKEAPGGGRIACAPADIDRCYAETGLPDLGDLLDKMVRWSCRERLPLRVEGPGYLDVHLYRQESRLVLHLVNLSGADLWPGYREEAYPVGPLRLRVELGGQFGDRVPNVEARVSGAKIDARREGEAASFELPTLGAYELLVLD